MNKFLSLLFLFTLLLNNNLSFAQSAQELVSLMTLEEKIKLLSGVGMDLNDNPITEEGAVGNVKGRVSGAAGATYGIQHLGIPTIILADGPAGVRINPIRENDQKTYYVTAFPIGTSLASSWNVELVNKVGKAIGEEAKEYGVDVLLAPALNIQRNPLLGRNFEYYSEDPIVSGKIASAYVNGIQSNGVGATVKHFAANNQETSRLTVDAQVSQRALREIYLRGFEIAIKESNPWAVMSAYNKINGTFASESKDLLTGILRNEWGYNGTVMTDWFGGQDFVKQVEAGNDLLMPGRKSEFERILAAVEDGKLSEAAIDRNVINIINLIRKTPTNHNYTYSNNPDLKKNASISREAGGECIILLKNDNKVLPINKLSVALFGNASYDTYIGGSGSGEVNVSYSISLYQGLINDDISINKKLADNYLNHIKLEKSKVRERKHVLEKIKRFPEYNFSDVELENLANSADYAIYTIGRNAGEGTDRILDKDYYLSDDEKRLIHRISQKFHLKNRPFIIVLNVDALIDMAQLEELSDAILLAWLPGIEAGHSIADIITGKITPSGKLPITIPMKYEDVPSSSTYPSIARARQKEALYSDGIYVGYRYYNTFNVKPAYEFGYGLSYTTFQYSNLKLSSSSFKDNLKIKVKITNTGNYAGKEVVQLYISSPSKSLEKPNKELKGFAKTRLLAPNESQLLEFTIVEKDLASFNQTQSAWISDSGKYKVQIGASCEDIKLESAFDLSKDIIVEKVENLLPIQTNINELTNK